MEIHQWLWGELIANPIFVMPLPVGCWCPHAVESLWHLGLGNSEPFLVEFSQNWYGRLCVKCHCTEQVFPILAKILNLFPMTKCWRLSWQSWTPADQNKAIKKMLTPTLQKSLHNPGSSLWGTGDRRGSRSCWQGEEREGKKEMGCIFGGKAVVW